MISFAECTQVLNAVIFGWLDKLQLRKGRQTTEVIKELNSEKSEYIRMWKINSLWFLTYQTVRKQIVGIKWVGVIEASVFFWFQCVRVVRLTLTQLSTRKAWCVSVCSCKEFGMRAPTFRCLEFHGWHADQPLIARDDRHFRKYPLRPGADACAMNDAMNVLRAIHDHACGCDANDGQMSASNEANVAGALDADSVSDAYTVRTRSDFRLLNAAYI